MAALKDVYSTSFYNNLTNCLIEVMPSFNKKHFLEQIFTDAFKQMELKERMRHTSTTLHFFLEKDFSKAVKQIIQLIKSLKKNNVGEDGLAMIFLPDYIEVYGINDFKHAVKAIETVTQFVSCEFAVRPFLLKYFNEMMPLMVQWSLHENYKVRRLASEGSRPRLPWAMAVPALKKDPSPILPLLENLKNDPSEWVRRSVANSLNDITKDHPTIVLKLAKQWMGNSKETDAIIKHGSRTLLKQGHTEILKYYGLNSEHITVTNFNIVTQEINIGESLAFNFTLKNDSKSEQKIRIEYGIYYKRKLETAGKKVFKISEKTYAPNETVIINRKQKFVLITTRKFYVGAHKLSIIINGEEKVSGDFNLNSSNN